MSEPQTEPQAPDEPDTPDTPDEPEQDAEPDEVGEPDEADAEPDEAIEPDEGDEPEPDGDEPQARALSEKDIERRYQKLQAEKVRHAKRVGEIMDEDATDLIPCPVCMDGIDGWIYPPEAQPLAPEAIARIRQVVGLPDYTNFRDSPRFTACPECDGLGEVITGSKVPGYETASCARCGKTGYVPAGTQANGHADVEAVPVVTGPTSEFAQPMADVEVQHLRERGFTVIPPMQPVAP